MKKILSLILSICCWMTCASGAHAWEDFKIMLGAKRGEHHIEYFPNTFKVYEQPMPFHIIIQNTTNTSLKLFEKGGEGSEPSLTFEIHDENYHVKRIKKKMFGSMTNMETFTYLDPGENKIIPMMINKSDWPGVPRIEEGKNTNYRIRILYNNDGRTLRSDFYNITLVGKRD